jgi:hypothetical protein
MKKNNIVQWLRSIYWQRFLYAACLPFLFTSGPKFPSPCYLLDIETVGIAVPDKDPAGRRINDLCFHHGKLFIGTGDAVVNTGPTPIVYYNQEHDTFITEFTIDDEAIYRYQTIEDQLVIPGVDATEEWTFGNFYIQSDTGWTKHRTIPHALHVNCLASFQDELYASTGAFGSIGDSIEHYFGAVFVSSDRGMTWRVSYATPSDEESVYRINALIVFNDHLYAFPYAYAAVQKHTIPIRFHEGLSDQPYADDHYLIFREAVFGNSDVFVHDGSLWRYADIIPEDKLCFAGQPVIFKDKLLIPTVSGEYIDYLILTKRKPAQATMRLYAYDGKTSTRLNLAYDRLIDMLAQNDTLSVLIQHDGSYYIAQTDDMKHWQYHILPQRIDDPRALAIEEEYFYIGTQDGTLHRGITGQRVKKRTDVMLPPAAPDAR